MEKDDRLGKNERKEEMYSSYMTILSEFLTTYIAFYTSREKIGQSPYPHDTDIYNCFDDPTLAREISFLSFNLMDLTVMSDEEIQRHGLAAFMELLLKHYHDKKIIRLLKKWLKDGGVITLLMEDDNYLLSVLKYVSTTVSAKNYNTQEFLDIFTETMPEKTETIMTIHDAIEQGGIEKGIEKGREEGIELAIKNIRDADLQKKQADEIIANLRSEMKAPG